MRQMRAHFTNRCGAAAICGRRELQLIKFGLNKKTKDSPQTRRHLTLMAINDRATRTEAAKIGGVGL